jgi:uncharacterized protein YprB with RNaseH-like and TPR domain
MNIGFFDIETTGFDPKKDRVLVVCIGNNSNSRIKVIKTGKLSEEQVIRESLSALSIYGSIVSWNGASFDVPFLSKRAQKYGMRFNHNFHIDLMQTSSKFFPKIDKSLETMALTFMISKEKMPFDTSIWRMAKSGDKESIEYIAEHCSIDVQLLKELWKKIME